MVVAGQLKLSFLWLAMVVPKNGGYDMSVHLNGQKLEQVWDIAMGIQATWNAVGLPLFPIIMSFTCEYRLHCYSLECYPLLQILHSQWCLLKAPILLLLLFFKAYTANTHQVAHLFRCELLRGYKMGKSVYKLSCSFQICASLYTTHTVQSNAMPHYKFPWHSWVYWQVKFIMMWVQFPMNLFHKHFTWYSNTSTMPKPKALDEWTF